MTHGLRHGVTHAPHLRTLYVETAPPADPHDPYGSYKSYAPAGALKSAHFEG